MKFEEAREQIKRDWRRIMPAITKPALKNENGETSWICPICGHGTHGNGLTYNKGSKHPDTELKCFGAGCEFDSGDIIRLYMLWRGLDLESGKDHRQAVLELAEIDGLIIDDDQGREEMTSKTRMTSQNAAEPILNTSADNLPADDLKAVKNDSDASDGKKQNTPGLYKADCEKWAANIYDTIYLTLQGIPVDIQERFNVGYIPETNQIVFPYDRDYSYWIKRTADKDDKKYRKPNADEAGPEPLYNSAALYHGGPCFICEGQIDVLSIATAGGNACAIAGTGDTALLDKVKAKAPAAPLILWLDNDLLNDKGHRPGQEEQKKIAAELTAAGIIFIEAQYNLNDYGLDHGDPNDLLQENPEQFAADVKANIDRAEALQKLGPDMGPFINSIYSERYKPIPTGIKGLDKFLHGGLIRQTLVLLSSKPGAGKTILASMIFESMAKQGIPSIYLNLEMSKEQLLARSMSRMLFTELNYKMDSVKVLQGYNHTPKEKELISSAAERYVDQIGPYMTYNPLETSDLDAILKYITDAAETAIKEGKPAPFVCVDYLHILTSTVEKDSGEIIKRAVSKLKNYAAKYNAIVLAIDAQSRAANKSKSADMAAGRDTSALEYSGDLILQLKSGDDEDPEHGDPNRINLYVTKSRFTEFDSKNGLPFIKHGGLSYFEQIGEWTNTPINERTPFDDDSDDDQADKYAGVNIG